MVVANLAHVMVVLHCLSLAAAGLVPIEDIRAGDEVWAWDGQTQTWHLEEVIEPLVHEYEGDVITITIGDDVIEATDNHPFWVVAGEALASRPPPADVPPADRQPSEAGLSIEPGQWIESNEWGESRRWAESDKSAESRRWIESGRWIEARDLQVGDALLLISGEVSQDHKAGSSPRPSQGLQSHGQQPAHLRRRGVRRAGAQQDGWTGSVGWGRTVKRQAEDQAGQQGWSNGRQEVSGKRARGSEEGESDGNVRVLWTRGNRHPGGSRHPEKAWRKRGPGQCSTNVSALQCIQGSPPRACHTTGGLSGALAADRIGRERYVCRKTNRPP